MLTFLVDPSPSSSANVTSFAPPASSLRRNSVTSSSYQAKETPTTSRFPIVLMCSGLSFHLISFSDQSLRAADLTSTGTDPALLTLA